MQTKVITLAQFAELSRQADYATLNGASIAIMVELSGNVRLIEDASGDECFLDRYTVLTLWSGDTTTFVKTNRDNTINFYKFAPLPVDFKKLL